MSCALAIFVKTPRLSAVKTRLASGAGRAFAQRLHRQAAYATASVARAVAGAHGIAPYWAVAEAGADEEWPSLPVVSQGEGRLGERMGRVHSELVDRHGAAILIGADSPQLEATDLAAAAERLDAAEPTFVIGPARDGGFWLVGANRRLPLTAWDGVTYSREDTRVRFVEAMRAHAGNVSALRLLRDVDDVDDVAPLVAALRRLRTPTAEQRRLLVWLEEAAPAIGIRLDRGPSI